MTSGNFIFQFGFESESGVVTISPVIPKSFREIIYKFIRSSLLEIYLIKGGLNNHHNNGFAILFYKIFI